jgi:hypothetical protein
MGVSVTDKERGDIDQALQALEKGLAEVGYPKRNGNQFEAPSN